jgi:hypothetical protein
MRRYFITRIEAAPDCGAQLDKIVERLGSTHMGVLSRLVKWAAHQDTNIQRAIFYQGDVASRDLILESLVEGEPAGQKQTRGNSR